MEPYRQDKVFIQPYIIDSTPSTTIDNSIYGTTNSAW